MNKQPVNEEETMANRGGSDQGSDGRDGMVVGVDGSAESVQALRWAHAHVGRFGPIRPVFAWQYAWWMTPSPFPGAPLPPPEKLLQQEAEARLEETLHGAGVHDHAKSIVRHAKPGPTLVANGFDARLIVVGTRGRGAVADAMLGSVSCHVVSHATVPVAVVPEPVDIVEPPRRVVVGVDGSENSKAALVWAIQNTPDDVPIEAVHVWHYALTALPEEGPIQTDVFETAAQQVLDRMVVEATLEAGGTRQEIVHRLEFGDPRSVLREVSEGSDLLVVGAQGHHGVSHLLLGSVATGLVHTPKITTVIVPNTTE